MAHCFLVSLADRENPPELYANDEPTCCAWKARSCGSCEWLLYGGSDVQGDGCVGNGSALLCTVPGFFGVHCRKGENVVGF